MIQTNLGFTLVNRERTTKKFMVSKIEEIGWYTTDQKVKSENCVNLARGLRKE